MEIILYINSKSHLYFITKNAIKFDKIIAKSQIIKRKNKSNIKNNYSQII